MKKIYFLLFTLIAFTSYGQNLAVNGGFETFSAGAFDSWTGEAGTTLTQNTTLFTEAAVSASFEVTTQTQGDTDFRQSITVTAGITYDVSVQIYQVDNGARARLYVDGYQGYSDPSLVGAWQTLTYTYTASATGNVDIGLRFYDTADFMTSSTILADDYQVVAQSGPSIAITSPADGSTIIDTNVDVVFAVQNFLIGNGQSDDGFIKRTLVTPSGTFNQDIFDTNPVNVQIIDGETYTITLELVDTTGSPLTPAQMSSVTFTGTAVTQVADLAALRADVTANGVGQFYELMNAPTVTYARAARNQKYIQDATAGILIDDNAGAITTTFVIGDGISGLIGQTSIFNGVLQFIPSQDATVATGMTITPEVVTIATLLANFADYQSELVQINAATFTETGNFAASTNYTINDASNIMPSSMTFRTNFSEADYIGQPIPSTSGDIVVLVGEFGGTPQVTARSMSDVTLSTTSFSNNSNFSMYPNPTNNGFVTITSGNSESVSVTIFDVLGKQVFTAQELTNNTLNVSSLNSGIYLVKITQNNASTIKKLVVK